MKGLLTSETDVLEGLTIQGLIAHMHSESVPLRGVYRIEERSQVDVELERHFFEGLSYLLQTTRYQTSRHWLNIFISNMS